MTGAPDALVAAVREHDIALAAFDVDGTLLTSDHRVTDRLVAAVAAARAAGVEVVLASSRGPSVLRPVLHALGLGSGMEFVASGGAYVGWRDDAGLLHAIARRPAPLEASRAFVRSVVAAGLAVNWFAGDHWYATAVDAAVEAEIRIVGVEPIIVPAPVLCGDDGDVPAGPRDGPLGPDKMLVMAPPGGPDTAAMRAAVVTALRAELPPGLLAQTSNATYLEVTGEGVDKAVALREMCAARGLSPYRLLAMGDGANDATMLALAGVAVAPANAGSPARAAAGYVVPGNDEDGAAIVLEALAGIRRTA